MTGRGWRVADGIGSWLGGLTPMWARLDPAALDALLRVRRLGDPPTHVAADCDVAALAASPVIAHARLVLRRLHDDGGAKLTATGNLNRTFVAEMMDAFRWPGTAAADIRAVSKVVNETDYMPLHFLRLILREAGLLRRHKGRMLVGRRGEAMLDDGAAGELMRTLLITTFGRFNLAYLDRAVLERFPQDHIAVVLCLLGRCAGEWRTPEALMKLAALPTDDVLDTPYEGLPKFVFESRVLRPLSWFGLLESREADRTDRLNPPEYRKTRLYDRVLTFDIRL